MPATSYSNFRSNLKHYIDTACDDSVPIFIKRRDGKNAVLICEETYRSMDETDYLLSNPANKKHLEESLAEIENGETVTFKSLKEFNDAFNI